MPFFDELSLTTFSARDRNGVSAVCTLDRVVEEDGQDHSAVFDCDLRQAHERAFLDLTIVGAARFPQNEGRLVLLGRWGDVRTIEDGRIFNEGFEASRGPMMRLRKVGDRLFAVGSALQALTRDADGWAPFGPDPERFGARRLTIFTDLDGFSADDLYVAGTQGTIWRWRDGEWRVIDCATNLSFHAIHCAEDGRVYACGQLGLLAIGDGDFFEIVSPESEPMSDLWGVVHFQGKLYCAAMRALLELEEGRLVPHIPAMRCAYSFYGLEAKDGILWACGEKNVLRFDGATWEAAWDLTWIPAED